MTKIQMGGNVLLGERRTKILFCSIFAILMLLFCSFSFFVRNNSHVYADSVTYSILNKDLGVLIDSLEKTNFTPINDQTGIRYGDENSSYRAYIPSLNSNYENGTNVIKYINQSIDLSSLSLNNIIVDYSKAMLKFWVYFDSIKVRDFSLALSMVNGDSITWNINHENLLKLIGDDNLAKGAGWSLIGISFSNGQVNEGGDIYDETTSKLETINSFQIKQEVSAENNNEVEMIFYDVQICEDNIQNSILIFETQPYFYYNLKNDTFFDNINSQVYVGDVWHIPNIAGSAGSFAWYGKQNLINSLYVTVNEDKNNKTKIGNAYTFESAGQISINLCGVLDEDMLLVFPEFQKNINVIVFDAVHLSITSLKAVIGSNYEITIIVNKKLSDLENLRISTSRDIISLSSIDSENKFMVTANKSGSSVVTVEFSAVRNGVRTEYTKDVEVTVSEKGFDKDKFAIIVCVIVLAGVVAYVVFMGIKSIKNANKYKVK